MMDDLSKCMVTGTEGQFTQGFKALAAAPSLGSDVCNVVVPGKRQVEHAARTAVGHKG